MNGRHLVLTLALALVGLLGCDASEDSAGFGDVSGPGPEVRGTVVGAGAVGDTGAAGAAGAAGPSAGAGGAPAPAGAGGMTGAGGAGAGGAPAPSGSGGAGAGGAGAAGAPGSSGAGGDTAPTYEACIDPGPASGCRRASATWANGTPFLNGYKDGMSCIQLVIAETGLPGPSECTIPTSAGNVLSVASCDECSFR